MHSLFLDMLNGNDRLDQSVRKRDSVSALPSRRSKRGRPQSQPISPLGKLILRAMRLLEFTYQDIASQSRRLSVRNNNSQMRIGKSTLGNIIRGTIRQPSGAKLDSLRSILHLSRADVEAALGLQPQGRVAEQLEMSGARTYELSLDEVTRQRVIRVPIAREGVDLNASQFLDGLVREWASVEVEYLSVFYPPHLIYVLVGEQDKYSSPVAPPGTRLLVNTFLTKVNPAYHLSYHERPLFYVLTPHGYTCSYLESAAGKIVLVPHPMSGHVREEFTTSEVKVIGQVVGLLFSSDESSRRLPNAEN